MRPRGKRVMRGAWITLLLFGACTERPRAPQADVHAQAPERAVPAPPAPRPFVQLAIAPRAVCATRDDGHARCWVEGGHVDLDTEAGIVEIAVSGVEAAWACVRRREGTLACGALRTVRGVIALEEVAGLANVTRVVGVRTGFCALANGAVTCFPHRGAAARTVITGLAEVEALFGATDTGAACARITGGKVRCFVFEPSARRPRPASEVRALFGATSIALSGQTWTWTTPDGSTSYGHADALRLGDVHTRPAPPLAAEVAMFDHTDACVRDRDARVHCRGAAVPSALAPDAGVADTRIVEALDGATAIAGAAQGACALVRGEVLCWGDNTFGRFGVPGPRASHAPARVEGIAGADALFVAEESACARVRGRLSCWGSALAGARDAPDRARPAPFVMAEATDIAWYRDGGCARAGDRIECWGRLSPRYNVRLAGSSIALEDEDAHTWNETRVAEDPTIAAIEGLPMGIVEMAVRREMACVRTSAGAMWCWYVTNRPVSGDTVGRSLTPPARVIDAHVTRMLRVGDDICAIADDAPPRCFALETYVDASRPLWVVRLAEAARTLRPDASAWEGTGQLGCVLVGTTVECRRTTHAWTRLEGVEASRIRLEHGAPNGTRLALLTASGRLHAYTLSGGATISYATDELTLEHVVEVGLGDDFGCARLQSNEVTCWGINAHGQLARADDVPIVRAPRALSRN